MESQRLGDYIVCNPKEKKKKGQQCQLTDIDSITIGQKYPISKGWRIRQKELSWYF